MVVRELPTPTYLRQLLRYDAGTGKLYWLAREAISFNGASNARREGAAARWNKLFAGHEAGRLGSRGYIQITIDVRVLSAHRIAWAIYNGSWPTREIDHQDGDRSNNRISNLREAGAENYKNIKLSLRNTSGVMGVRFDRARGKWRATVTHNLVVYNLGSFRDKSDATDAVLRKREEIGGYTDRHGV